MAIYSMEDGTIVDTAKAVASWEEAKRWNGSNMISKATGSQWNHETLYKSRKGRYYVEESSQWQGSLDSARFLTREEAARWLLVNDEELPEDLAEFAADLVE